MLISFQICQVVIGEAAGQGMRVVSKCLWDTNVDNWASFSYKTPTVVPTDRVKSVSCGGLHILALTDAGEVLSFGQGNYGQLGHGDQLDQREPKVVEALRGKHVNAIAAGNLHS